MLSNSTNSVNSINSNSNSRSTTIRQGQKAENGSSADESTTIEEEQQKPTLLGALYNSVVNFIAEFIAAILSHPKVSAALNDIIMTAINSFMEQPDLGDKITVISTAMVSDISRHEETARTLGKDVPKLVSGFMGGLTSNMSIRKKRTSKQEVLLAAANELDELPAMNPDEKKGK